MASLMEELLDVLGEEKAQYEQLLAYETDKRQSIIKGDTDSLEQLTTLENDVTTVLKNLENKRYRILKDMSVVLGKDDEDISVGRMIQLLEKQPKEQQTLIEARDALVDVATKMQLSNQQNAVLLQQSLEMVEFDLTLLRSMKQAPETANYNRFASNTGDLLGSGSFDASQ